MKERGAVAATSSESTNGRPDPVFTPAPGSPADRIGTRLQGHRPIVAGLVVWAGALFVLAVVVVGLGWVLTHDLLTNGVGRVDGTISHWFLRMRTPTLNTVTRIGSDIGSTNVVLGVALLAVIALAIGKRWRQIAFLIAALTLEISVFLIATFLISRGRPLVPHLDVAPPTSSYPSGHTAAAIALYVGLAIIIWSLVRSIAVRIVAWVMAVALPLVVANSRLYRGMHHFTDVLASVVLGVGAILFALLATRSGVAAADARRRRTAPRPGPSLPLEEVS